MNTRKSRATTIVDVAAAAGVSVSTASKALNGRHDVGTETRQRVMDVAARLSYRPNVNARSLLEGQSRLIGLITSDSVGRFSIPVLLGAEDALGGEEMAVLLCDARGDADRERRYIQTLLERRVDGIIVVGQSTDPRPSLGHRFPIPVVYAYAQSEDPTDLSILPDDASGAELAVQHLIDAGRRRIAHVTGPEYYLATRDRVGGVHRTLDAAGLTLAGGRVLHGTWSQRWGRAAGEELLHLAPDVDAVFCGSDQIASGLAETLHDSGRRVPDDISIVGYDNWDVIASEAQPPLTTVEMDLEKLGRTAAQRIFEAIDGKKRSGVELMPCRLVVRESSVTGAA